MSKIVRYITGSFLYKRLIKKLYNIQIYHTHVSLFRFIVIFLRNFKKHEVADRASAVAYNFTVALFPGLIFLFALIPYIPIPNLYESILDLLGDAAMLDQLTSTIKDIVSRPRGDLLSFSVITTLYLATNGMLSLITAFNKIYRTVERRNLLRKRLIAFTLTIMLAFTLFIAVALLVVGQVIMDFMLERGFLTKDLLLYGLIFTRFLVVAFAFLMAVSIMYYFGPALHDKWKFFSSGSLIATCLILVVSYGFSFYIANFGTYNKLYGSIGAMIALMVWLYFISLIILTGFEINASYERAIREAEKKMKNLVK